MTRRQPVPAGNISFRATATAWDGRRARSRQVKVGPSELGSCRRRVAYRLARQPRDNWGDPMKAVMGTLLHQGVLPMLKAAHGGLTEVKVESPLVRGSADYLRHDEYDLAVLLDVKTKGTNVFESTIRHPTTQDTLWQTMTYADLIRKGLFQRRERRLSEPVEVVEVQVLYLNRDTGADHTITHPFDQAVADEAAAWGQEVVDRTAADGVSLVPRDRNGPGLDVVCDNCPFLNACWGEQGPRARQGMLLTTDDEVAAAIREYDELGVQEKAVRDARALVRAKLDAQPAQRTPDGYELRWAGENPKVREVRDQAEVDRWLAAAGLEPPTVTEAYTTARSIKVLPPKLAAAVPDVPEE